MSIFLQSFTSRVRNVLLEHNINTEEDLINFAKKYDLKKLHSDHPNKLSLESIKQLEQFIPKDITTLHWFYAQFPTRIENFLKKNDIRSIPELNDFLHNNDLNKFPSTIGKLTYLYLKNFMLSHKKI